MSCVSHTSTEGCGGSHLCSTRGTLGLPTSTICDVAHPGSRSNITQISQVEEMGPGSVWGSVHAQSELEGWGQEGRGEEGCRVSRRPDWMPGESAHPKTGLCGPLELEQG